ncbi:uncharacterized protein CLUP02_08917 [Colletotrichum lupini]|uniref:Uncharacterized protein n=1 Tax=Colletotrichum lupini TaxID=145971 RepID=A0A9Q8WHX2_9PEZI|nr:uncharacterized protein CLUP02_08917 [Colletotrichum lupini]UQC83422.1 hypothetical protein CLUP02_08917 [Colletotrichum lupini]
MWRSKCLLKQRPIKSSQIAADYGYVLGRVRGGGDKSTNPRSGVGAVRCLAQQHLKPVGRKRQPLTLKHRTGPTGSPPWPQIQGTRAERACFCTTLHHHGQVQYCNAPADGNDGGAWTPRAVTSTLFLLLSGPVPLQCPSVVLYLHVVLSPVVPPRYSFSYFCILFYLSSSFPLSHLQLPSPRPDADLTFLFLPWLILFFSPVRLDSPTTPRSFSGSPYND